MSNSKEDQRDNLTFWGLVAFILILLVLLIGYVVNFVPSNYYPIGR